ncbi:MAG: hypothetical protein Q7U97_05300 [Rhodocyclaceae bacterium]|nr:hypothetical protein [Rhodocyclaceae bacterium]
MANMGLQPGEDQYVEAMRKVLTDKSVQQDLEKDAAGTLERLGFDLSDDVKKELRMSGATQPELGVAAVPAVLVRVATNGTRPAVSVVVRSSTIARTRGEAVELREKK